MQVELTGGFYDGIYELEDSNTLNALPDVLKVRITLDSAHNTFFIGGQNYQLADHESTPPVYKPV